MQRQYTVMKLIRKYSDLADKALAAGAPVSKIANVQAKQRLAMAKYETNIDDEYVAVGTDLEKEFAGLGV
jgi:V/A-type H+-transporting ATPase subunit A